jgi:heat shock protein 4
MEAIEKQRKILSGNAEHDLNLECLMEDSDLQFTMTREQFEKISEPILKAIEEILTKVKDSLKAKTINLHSIELVGGGSRIPAFVNAVKHIFGI